MRDRLFWLILALVAVILLALCATAPAWAQDETLLPDGDNANDGNTSCDTNAYLTLNDDPAGGDWCTADNDNTSWSFTFTMQNPASGLDTTTDAQTIRYYARSFNEAQSGDPTIQMFIYDTTTTPCDTLHESGTLTTLTDAGFPATITDTWTAAGLSSGNDVCVRIDCTKTGGPPAARNSCDIDAVVWDAVWAAGARRRHVVVTTR